MVALWAANVRWRCPRNPTILGSEMQTQDRVFRAHSRDRPKVCRAHGFRGAAKFRKPNCLSMPAAKAGSSLCLWEEHLSLFLFTLHRLFFFFSFL